MLLKLRKYGNMPKISQQLIYFLSIVFMFAYTVNSVNCYNLSPKPNVVIKDPQLATSMPKVQSSYFGFSMNLRQSGIIVGAPRAQSTLESQRNINETGAIYRCSLTTTTCSPYVFESDGNRKVPFNGYTDDSEKRDFQWLGASMDGGAKDTDKLLVCAPRFVAPTSDDYLMHGVCYWINDTISQNPTNVQKISPLRLRTDQIRTTDEGKRYYFYYLAEQGLSAHITENNEEILIGAPGIHNWKGSVIRYRKHDATEDPSLSRRDTTGKRVPRQADITYLSDIPNPEKWEQDNDSYFGYSVSSGHFDSSNPTKVTYVASAPQAKSQTGEAYIFDFTGNTITKNFVFFGEQFGEYYGYAVLAEDLNGDGLTDVIVSAPQHRKSGSFDDGAIYVYINKANFSFEKKILTSPVSGQARFGTTLTKLGDINGDGFNDIAVGAPFAGNGQVFIYLGSEKGLREHPSQHLKSPTSVSSKYGAHMFGHGLSKGSDIDNNGFNDFAIGAPNAESIFVYRAYPVVKVITTINSDTREIKPDQKSFKLKCCYKISTKSTKVKNQDLTLKVVVDPQVKRVKIAQTQANEMSFNVSAGLQTKCSLLDADIVSYNVADIFKPIELEIHYDIIKGVPMSEVFCEDCVAVDPLDPKVFVEKLIFSTGCKSDICIADLKVRSRIGADHSYILGSSRTLSITYDINNMGETAYLPQINLTSSNRMPFARIPSNCRVNNEAVVMVCDLNRGQPMANGNSDSITVIYDVSGISGKTMILTAEVFSTGVEQTPTDNIVRDVITLKEYTEIEAVGIPKTPYINLEKVFNTTEIVNSYEIKSNGPSRVGALEIVFNIPIAYKVQGSSATIPIINSNNITMQAVYDSQLVGIDYYDNNTQLLMNTYEITSKTTKEITKVFVDSMNGIHYDSSKVGHIDMDFGHSSQGNDLENTVMVASMTRKRRELATKTATKDQYARLQHVRAYDLLGDDLKDRCPVNRTIVFNCQDPTTTSCIRAVMHVYNYKPDKPITITMKYNVDLKEVNQILIEPWDYFVIHIGLDIARVGDSDGKSISVVKKIEYNVISKYQLYSTPIWVIILAVIGGLLLLALMTYLMYRYGFFKRSTRDEMDKLVNQNQAGADVEPEAENLNTERN
ncbi:integrin alpha-PS3 isoform X1 [Teleopsis dalmanni]|uniref:integrin alpha-PS3 isoform X1 n=1 Tax=Teleopsis dalmanni TaxID=139649 RepID=UPI000D32B1F3|nr:integrin alpha-PS3 isoform X1 [Teleopsis dalmanni]